MPTAPQPEAGGTYGNPGDVEPTISPELYGLNEVASFLEAAISGTFSWVPAVKSLSPLSALAAASTYHKEEFA